MVEKICWIFSFLQIPAFDHNVSSLYFFENVFLIVYKKRKKEEKKKRKKEKKKTASSFVLKSLYSKTKFGLWMYDTKIDSENTILQIYLNTSSWIYQFRFGCNSQFKCFYRLTDWFDTFYIDPSPGKTAMSFCFIA